MNNSNQNQKIVNGVNIGQMFENAEAVNHNKETAKFKFKAKGNWVNGGYNITTINDFYGVGQTHNRSQTFIFDQDEPFVLLGTDKNASVKGIMIDEVESTLEDDLDLQGAIGLDENVRNGYQKINVTFRIRADNVSDQKLKDIAEIVQKRSPVFDIISNPTPIYVNVERK